MLKNFKKNSSPLRKLFVYLEAVFLLLLPLSVFAQDAPPVDKDAINQQIQQFEMEAAQLSTNLDVISGERRTLFQQVSLMNAEVSGSQLEIKRLDLAFKQADIDIAQKNHDIQMLSDRIQKGRRSLGASLLLMYTYDQDDTFSVFIKNRTFSDFFGFLNGLKRMQVALESLMGRSRDEQKDLEQQKIALEQFKTDQQQLKVFQEVEHQMLDEKKKEKDELLRLTKGKEELFQKLLNSKQQNIATLQQQLYYLEKTGIVIDDALKAADLAAKRAGIRTSFLLALLEVETGQQFENGVITVGTNLGSGNWRDDLYGCYINLGKSQTAESERAAFFAIAKKTGTNPETAPVSRKPAYGCGGAIGPAQFLPTTWLKFEARVAELTGHSTPNPWNLEDAFMGAALLLADSGASSQNVAGETRAARVYISGQPNCTRSVCTYYTKRILSLAKDIDRIL